MSYYSERRQAINMIDTLISEGKSEAKIAYVIGKRFGFGRKMVKDRLKLLRDVVKEGEKNDE